MVIWLSKCPEKSLFKLNKCILQGKNGQNLEQKDAFWKKEKTN
jgi:hypothetical protein